MGLTKDHVQNALRTVLDPQLHRDLVTLGAVRKIAVCDTHAAISVCLAHASAAACDAVRRNIIEAVGAHARGAGVSGGPSMNVFVEFVDAGGKVVSSGGAPSAAAGAGAAQAPGPGPGTGKSLPGIAHIVAVGAGKGGVGKSTVAVNLAVGLARQGLAVGLLDGDIYGPSLPTLMGLDDMTAQVVGNSLQPFYVHGVKCMTIGKLVDPEKPLIWRGPMAHGAFKQLVDQTNWGELDFLIIDLPPGTGDVSLTMAQLLSLDGAVVVCTPQKVAQDDAVRAARMFQQLGIEVLGVVENMSYFIGDDAKEYDIFGRGGAERMAQRLGLAFLGAIPIHMSLRQNSDSGEPGKNFTGNEALRGELEGVVNRLRERVEQCAARRHAGRPRLTVS